MGKIIAVANQKGGVGKSTTSICLAAGLQRAGKMTLLIDTDSQRNSTDTYKAESDGVATLYDLLFNNENFEECVQHREAGDIIASDSMLEDAEMRFPTDASRNHLMKFKCREFIDKYDYIIIDTPPKLGVMLTNVLTFATDIIIPITPDYYALQGMADFLKTIKATRMYTNPGLRVRGILVTKYHRNCVKRNKTNRLC